MVIYTFSIFLALRNVINMINILKYKVFFVYVDYLSPYNTKVKFLILFNHIVEDFMKNELLIPLEKNFSSLYDSGGLAMPTCMTSCRGCQCRVNPFDTEDIFEEELLYAPNEDQYKSILDPTSSNPAYITGGCPCNCTSCNSCRCDCRNCDVGRIFSEDLDSVWI